MKKKLARLEIIRLIISSKEISSQDELLQELAKENIVITQATLSRDLKQLKVAKAASITGKPLYVLPNNTMYRRVKEHTPVQEMLSHSGVKSIHFSGNLAVIRTRPGYASSVAYDIDNANIPEIIGTVAGDDTIIIALEETYEREVTKMKLEEIIKNM
ncbi:MAG: arginine repressor [Bacteroidaceae bacterium]|nr:arginine repressor [Bacteroidaceae bacterium]MBQ9175562.1 arginine repressor [Bacteroidaceae bacterium]MBR1378342.1 arginine repressor [Bacteroidaceae bacterium]